MVKKSGFKTAFLLGILLISIILIFISCSIFNPYDPYEHTGSIAPRILFKKSASGTIEFDSKIKSSLRKIVLEVNHGGGFKCDTFDYSDKQGEIDGIREGKATVTVLALDNMNETVVTGTVEARVQSGQTAAPEVLVVPKDSIVPYLAEPVFKTENSGIELNWIVWEQTPDKGTFNEFVIQRRENGNSFYDVGRISTSQSTHTDFNSIMDNNTYFYRIKVERSGPALYSNTQNITVNFGGGTQTGLVPNL
ncbi:MAG: hypothetical protein ABIA63_02435, partial [bacterium]